MAEQAERVDVPSDAINVPLRRIAGREVMDPEEVAVRISNVARASGRKRAIFDAALASGSCLRPELMRAVESLSIRVSGPPAWWRSGSRLVADLRAMFDQRAWTSSGDISALNGALCPG